MSTFVQHAFNGLSLGGIYALYALGLSLVLANLRVFHLAHAAIFAWGAITAWWMMSNWQLPLVAALPLTVIFCGVLNVLAYQVLLNHLHGRTDHALAGFISSLGGFIVLVELGGAVLGNQARRLPLDAFPLKTWEIGDSFRFSSVQLLVLGTAGCAFAALYFLVHRTRFGREIKAVAFDGATAALLGVNSEGTQRMVFLISGGFAGLSGVLVAIAFNVVDSHMGGAYLVIAIAATVIGGFGSVVGVIVGSVLIGLCSSFTIAYVTSSYRDAVVFALLMAFLIVRPQGLFGRHQTAERP